MSGTGSIRRPRYDLMALVFFGAFGGEIGALWAQPIAELQREVVVGIVRDGAHPGDDLVARVEAEVSKHVLTGTTVRFKQDPSFNAEWDTSQVSRALRAALEDPEVDFVLADGLYVTLEAAEESVELVKPVISMFVQRADLFRLPYGEGDRSLKENLSFTVLPQRPQDDIEAFQEMLRFDSLHVTLDADDVRVMPELAERLEDLERSTGLDIRLLPTSDDVGDILAAVDESVAAVYLTRTPRLSVSERQRLITGLTEKGVPTFSLMGHPDVRLGALAAASPGIDLQLVRRIALNLAWLIRGGSIAELPVLLSMDTRLLINARTAVAIGYVPKFETRIFAEILHSDAFRGEESEALRFSEALFLAKNNNTFLSIQDELVEGVRQDRARTRSALLPRIGTNLRYSKSNLGDALEGIIPKSATLFGISIRQLIFDDAAISDYRSSIRLYEGSAFEREAERINVLGAAGTAFLGFGLTRAIYGVEADNLRLSQANLGLARLRRDEGYSGRDEIFRWEAIVARNRNALLTAARDVEAALFTLNQVMGVEQTRQWLPVEVPVDPSVFPFLDGRLDPVFQNPEQWDRFQEVLVRFAIANSPEVKAIDRQLEAFDIRVGQFERRFYLPSAFFDLSYNYQLSGGKDDLPSRNKHFYLFSFGASYPVFEGLRKSADIAKARADRRALDRQRQFISELIEQETRTALAGCETSFPRIKFSRQAAEAATNNLSILEDKYAEGIVTVTDVTSAQNEKLVAEQLAAATVYEFLIDLVELQRAISWFEDDKTSEEQDAFVESVAPALRDDSSR